MPMGGGGGETDFFFITGLHVNTSGHYWYGIYYRYIIHLNLLYCVSIEDLISATNYFEKPDTCIQFVPDSEYKLTNLCTDT